MASANTTNQQSSRLPDEVLRVNTALRGVEIPLPTYEEAIALQPVQVPLVATTRAQPTLTRQIPPEPSETEADRGRQQFEEYIASTFRNAMDFGNQAAKLVKEALPQIAPFTFILMVFATIHYEWSELFLMKLAALLILVCVCAPLVVRILPVVLLTMLMLLVLPFVLVLIPSVMLSDWIRR